MKSFLTRKLLLFVLAVLVLVASVSLSVYYSSSRIAGQGEKISEMNATIIALEGRMNFLIVERVHEQNLTIIKLKSRMDLLEHRVVQLERENEKLKEAIDGIHDYNQLLLKELSEDTRSSAEKISNKIGNIVKSFIF